MRIKNLFSPKKHSSAQTMVEFALVLPILLLLIFGLIEAGRLLFIYGSITTSSREAVRYGSATGDNGSGTLKYQDCDGIRQAAKDMGFILAIEDADIDIQYERDGISIGNCNGASYNGSAITNGDRISVTVVGNYSPLVPLVPFTDFPITTASKRTIFTGIVILSTPGPVAPSPGLTLTKSASPTTYSGADETITYTLTLTNSGEVDFSSYEITDPMLPSMSCSGGAFVQGATRTCTQAYTTTATDLANGDIDNIAYATASDGSTPIATSASETVTFVPAPELSLTIEATPTVSTTVGALITYTYTLENTGSVDIVSPYSISDDTATNINCSGATSPLAPGDTTVCTGEYTLTQNDLDASLVINHATAEGIYNSAPVVSNESSATVLTKPLWLTKTASPDPYDAAGDIVTYTYHLQNVGEPSLDNFSIDDDQIINIVCPSVVLALNDTTDCTITYEITQDDIDLGYITNIATAYAESGTITSNTDELTIYAAQDPALTLEKSGPASALSVGEITYTYTLTNSGNMTLSSPYIIEDDRIDAANIDCSAASSPLFPEETTTCTGTYEITVDDLGAGSVTNTATATADIYIEALDGTQTVTSESDSFIVVTHDAPRLTLEKTADVTEADVGDTIIYTYTLRNTGNTTLTRDYTVTDDILGSIDCAGILYDLELGESATCTGVYSVFSGDVNIFGNLVNTATATASNGSVISAPVSLTIPVTTFICDITHNGPITISAAATSTSWTVTNNTLAELDITAINVAWGARDLTSISLNSLTLWSGFSSSNTGYYIPTLTQPWTLQPGINTIDVTFSKNSVAPISITLDMTEPSCASVNSDS